MKIIDDIKKKNYGDAVAGVTKATGIHSIVKKVSDLTGLDCGCDARRERWNYGKKDDTTTQTGY